MENFWLLARLLLTLLKVNYLGEAHTFLSGTINTQT
uniref:Uncharacterized protein n=1 Tax=Rhizophora mucronata TaxID=61149 RepID=A0A2P2QJJ7_RHIMU